MGAVCSANAAQKRVQRRYSKVIDKHILMEERRAYKEKKLLMLGSGGSGKSTFVKQLTNLFGEKFDERKKRDYKETIHDNIIRSIRLLLKHAYLDLEDSPEHVLYLTKEFIEEKRKDLLPRDSDRIAEFWRDPDVQNVWSRRNEFHITENTEYFMQHVARICSEKYLPALQDIFFSRSQTQGIIETMIQLGNIPTRIVDVGGQRSMRRKWIHCFEGCTAVIFVAAISEYDETLPEDESMNSVKEAVYVFEEVINSRYLASCSLVLLMNKSDIFREKISKKPLKSFFPEYKGEEGDFDAAVHFLYSKFEKLVPPKRKTVFFKHITHATETSNVEFTFHAVRNTILTKGLFGAGSV